MKRCLHSVVMLVHATRLRRLVLRIEATMVLSPWAFGKDKKAHHFWQASVVKMWNDVLARFLQLLRFSSALLAPSRVRK
jgi:hypothetical protein